MTSEAVEHPRNVRVAFVTHYSELYGANRSLLDLIDGLSERGVACHVVAPCEGKLTERLPIMGVPYSVIPVAYWMSPKRPGRGPVARALGAGQGVARSLKDFARNTASLPRLLAALRAWKIDLVYTNSLVTPIGALAAAMAGLPHVWHIREFGEADYDLRFQWWRPLVRALMRGSAATIAVSNAVRSHLDQASLASRRLAVVYNGVAREGEFERRRLLKACRKVSDQPFTFTLLGLLQPRKGQLVAITAFASVAARIPNVRLLIVGAGAPSFVEECQRLAQTLGVAQRVEFWGQVEDPEEAFLDADVVLMCSEREAMGRVTVEAMSYGCPVIGHAQGGTLELVDHERTGLLYRGGANALEECMNLLAGNPDLARRMGSEGWIEARKRYTIEGYSNQVYRLVREALNIEAPVS